MRCSIHGVFLLNLRFYNSKRKGRCQGRKARLYFTDSSRRARLIFTIDGYNRSSSKEQGSCGRIPYGKEVISMDNENKWEYDYSSQDKNESGDTGYPNVGSSGMNTANQQRPGSRTGTAYTEPNSGRRRRRCNAAGLRYSRRTPRSPLKRRKIQRQARCTQRRRAGAGRSHGLCGRLCGGTVWRQRQGGHPAGGTFLYGRAVLPARIVPSPQQPAAAAA